jgi:glycosyltransferase involved in cell wall biosynthesis
MIAPLGLARAVRELRPHVVHLHSGAWFKPALGARLAGVRSIIYTEHGRVHYDPWMLRQLDRVASHWTSRVVAVSDTLASYLRLVVRVPSERLLVIENGVDVTRFHPAPPSTALRERLGLPAGALVVGALGRLEQVKGYDRLLQVFRELRDRETRAAPRYLVIAGEGSEREGLHTLAVELGIQDRVIFPGWMDEPAGLYRLFDVFAVTSRSEGLSLSLLEAMACGVVPVVTDVGANRLVLGDALEALVHPEDAWPAFAASVETLLVDPTRRGRLSELAVQRVRERFALSRVVAQYRSLYEELAGGPQSGQAAHRGTAESGQWVA